MIVALGAVSGSMSRDVDLVALTGDRGEIEAAADEPDAIDDLAELAFASNLDDELVP